MSLTGMSFHAPGVCRQLRCQCYGMWDRSFGEWVLISDLASPTKGQNSACSLSADAPCLLWQEQRVVIICI